MAPALPGELDPVDPIFVRRKFSTAAREAGHQVVVAVLARRTVGRPTLRQNTDD
jgi:hypothetical protein